MFNSKILLKGSCKLVLTDAFGNIKDERQSDNLVVATGLTYICDRMKNNSTVITHGAVGSGSTAAASGNTDLGSIIGSRVAITSATPSSNTIAYIVAFGAGVSTGSITEFGLFNASSSGSMLARVVFGTITKASGDSLSVTHTLTLSAS